MGTIATIQADIVEEFDMFEDWMQKYEYIIELGKNLPIIDDKHKTDHNLIKGCQSRVWLHAYKQDGKMIYSADSDAIITKGIVAILIRVLSNQNTAEIAKADLAFIDEIGLKEQLSQTRANGLGSMIKEMKLYALAYQNK
jgi:cysteine desulfuration protein SufE